MKLLRSILFVLFMLAASVTPAAEAVEVRLLDGSVLKGVVTARSS